MKCERHTPDPARFFHYSQESGASMLEVLAHVLHLDDFRQTEKILEWSDTFQYMA